MLRVPAGGFCETLDVGLLLGLGREPVTHLLFSGPTDAPRGPAVHRSHPQVPVASSLSPQSYRCSLQCTAVSRSLPVVKNQRGKITPGSARSAQLVPDDTPQPKS